MGFLVFLVLLAVGAVVVGAVVKGNQRKALERKQAELEPVRKLAFEDVTALGEELQQLDVDLAGHQLDPGENADYQRALDSYESAKTAADSDQPARAGQARHGDPRGRALRDGLRPGPRRRRAVADPPPAVLLRPPPRPVRRGRVLRAAGRRPARRTRLCPRRRAGPGRRRARHPQGDGRLAAGALLAGRPRLPALRPGLLRRLRDDGHDVHGHALRRRLRRTG